MPSVLSILGASADSALAEADAAKSPNFHRTFDFVTQVFPWVADGEGQSHPWTDDIPPPDDSTPKIDGVMPGGFVLAANGTIVTRADIEAGTVPPAGPYRFAATVRLTSGDGSARNPFFNAPVETLGILSIASTPSVTPDLAFTVPEVHATPADLITGGTPGLTGQGIIVGFVDFGFDFAHPNFLQKFDPVNPNNPPRTRLLALWDQNDLTDPPAPTGVDAALDQLKPSSGTWANNYSNSYIYTPDGTFKLLATDTEPAVNWTGTEFGINVQLTKKDPYDHYYDPHRHYFVYPSGSPKSHWVPDDAGAHGTHVADIAAGNGAATGRPGVAPEADIVFVQLQAPNSPNGPANRGSVLDAVQFIASLAKRLGKRAVINICANANADPHDSHDANVKLLDTYPAGTWDGAPHVHVPIVISAGNQFVLGREPARFPDDPANKPLRKSYRETLAQRVTMPGTKGSNHVMWIVRKGDKTDPDTMELWYRQTGVNERVSVTVSSALLAADVVQHAANSGLAQAIAIGGVVVGMIKARLPIASGPRQIVIEINPSKFPPLPNPNPPPNQIKDYDALFVVRLDSTSTKGAHAWVQRDGMASPDQSAIAIRNGDVNNGTIAEGCTLGALSCGDMTIAVGAYFATDRSGKDATIAEFSSGGPAVNYADLDSVSPDTGSKQPHISAPGVIVAAARSKGGRLPGAGYSVVMSGTSMAAPHVTGTVALMLQNKPLATTASIRTALQNTARRDPQWYDPLNPWHKRFGYGRLDVNAAVKALV